MERVESRAMGSEAALETSSESRSETVDYIYGMIEQMARLARRSGETAAAIHLEAIIAVRRAIAKDRSVP